MTRYFLDTEFNGIGGDLISLALVAENGAFLYLATECRNPVPWVAEHVIPIIDVENARPFHVKPYQFGDGIKSYLGDDPSPEIVADWPDDIRYFCQCMIIGPGQMINIRSIKFELCRVDSYP